MNLDESLIAFREPIEETGQLAVRAAEAVGQVARITDRWPEIQETLRTKVDGQLRQWIDEMRCHPSRLVALNVLERRIRLLRAYKVYYKAHPLVLRMRMRNSFLSLCIVVLRFRLAIRPVTQAVRHTATWARRQLRALFSRDWKHINRENQFDQ